MEIDIGIAAKDRKKIANSLRPRDLRADLATTRMQAHENTAWMLRSLLQ